MGEYIKINETLYTDKKHLFLVKICDYCNSEFLCRKDKISTKKTCNKICYQKLIEKNKIYEINSHTNDVIIGSLLSDGCINNSNGGKNYFWTHTSINEEYIDFLINDTMLDLHKFSNKSIKFLSTITNKEYTAKKSYTFKSMASVSFTKYRNDWYPVGKKIVPKDIKITPTILLHWYLGDGFISDSNGITLATDSFDFDSLDFLIYELNNLDLHPYINYLRNRIIIPNKRVLEFLNYIGKCPIKCFDYKWQTFIKTSYIGRKCLNCNTLFDALSNHQKYCNPRCAIDFSNKNDNKLKIGKSNQPSVF